MHSVQLRKWLRICALAFGVVAMALMLAWLMGAFRTKIAPGAVVAAMPAIAVPTVEVRRELVVAEEDAIGTVRAVREIAVASRLLGRVAAVMIEHAGQQVRRDDLLVRLEADDLRAALDAAAAALAAAVTRRDKARLDRERTAALVQSGVASSERLDTDAAALAVAEAEVEQRRQAVAGAETSLAFAEVRAPIDGVIVDKLIEVGDVVQPGQLLCTLYDAGHLQLVATVREELAGVLQIGQAVAVTIDAIGESCEGSVAEVVPAADARSRSFEVKVVGPCHPRVVTGMFGRLHVPRGEREVLRIPVAATASIGQLDFVYAVGADGGLARRYVRLGDRVGDRVEVLAGLTAGERIAAAARGL